MKIVRDGKKTTVFPQGRIDANGAPGFAEEMQKALMGAEEFVIDLSELEYMSSSGLRAVMLAVKTMNSQGEIRIVNVSESMYNILELTGFTGVCEVEHA